MSRRALLHTLLWTVTWLRVVLVPVFVWAGSRAQDLGRAGANASDHRLAVVAILALIGASDVLDGWIARRFDLASQIGAIVDAGADKLAQVAFIAFFALSRGPSFQPLPVGYLLVLVGRDLIVAAGWLGLRARYGPFQVIHRVHGRAATVSVFALVFWLTLDLPEGGTRALTLTSSALIVASGVLYAMDGFARAPARAPEES